jgi:hypothetical protein
MFPDILHDFSQGCRAIKDGASAARELHKLCHSLLRRYLAFC